MDRRRVRQTLRRLWPSLTELARVARGRGGQAYLVGGVVRDLLLGRPARDVDVVIVGDAPFVAAAAARRLGGVVRRSPAFLTAAWSLPSGEVIDVVTARRETYIAPAALPVVTAADIEADLWRRDFSINAMALTMTARGPLSLLDPTGGLADLRRRTLRILHTNSFLDDPTRAFRAARLLARFGFTLNAASGAALRRALKTDVFGRLSAQRIGAELAHLFCEPAPMDALMQVKKLKLASAIASSLRLDRTFMAQSRRLIAVTQALNLAPVEAFFVQLSMALSDADRSARRGLASLSKGRQRRFLHSPQRLANVPKSPAAAFLRAHLDNHERAFYYANLPVKARHLALAAEQRGDVLKASVVTGAYLKSLGYAPGPNFKRAIFAAQQAAASGASAAEQRRHAQEIMCQATALDQGRRKG